MLVSDGVVDLAGLALSHGQASSGRVEARLRPVTLGDTTYEPEAGGVVALLDVSRTASGYALRMRFDTTLAGPCVRCLEPAYIPLSVDVREVEQPGAGDEELTSPYVDEERLNVDHWAGDAVTLALPARPLCRDDCAGLCAVCGVSLNDADPADHEHGGGGDPRFAALRDLKLD